MLGCIIVACLNHVKHTRAHTHKHNSNSGNRFKQTCSPCWSTQKDTSTKQITQHMQVMSWFSNYFQSSPGQVSSDCTACGSSPKSHGAMEAFRESASTGHLGRSQGESARDRVLHRRHAKSSPSHPPIDAGPPWWGYYGETSHAQVDLWIYDDLWHKSRKKLPGN